MSKAKATASSGVTVPLVSRDGELVIVGNLTDTRVLHLVRDFADWAEHGSTGIKPIGASAGRLFAAATYPLPVSTVSSILNLAPLSSVQITVIRVHDLDIVSGFTISAVTSRVHYGKLHLLRPFAMHAQGERLDVQDNVGHVFADFRQRRTLQHSSI